MDDDITNIDLSFTDFDTLDDFFVHAFQQCQEHKSFIWGVYACNNKYWIKDKKHCMTTRLNFCVGAFYGIINRPNHPNLELRNYLDGDEKEDVLRTLLYFINDGIVLKFQKVLFETEYYGKVGGMGKKQERIDASVYACNILQNKFADYGKMSFRESGIAEFKLKKNIESFNPDRTVCLLPKIDDLLIDNLYYELQKITIPFSNSHSRSNNKSRSVVFGLTKGRVSKKVDLSAYSKKHPHIWEIIQQIGNQLPNDFEYNSVFLNHNVVCNPHKDKNNVGKSILLSFGEYSGCNIVIENVEYDANRQPVLFNGALLEHYNTNDLIGNKYSLVFFKGNYDLNDNEKEDVIENDVKEDVIENVVIENDVIEENVIENVVIETLICSSCFENVNDNNIELGENCGHPMCSRCLKDYKLHHTHNKLQCPVCRAKWNKQRGRGRPKK